MVYSGCAGTGSYKNQSSLIDPPSASKTMANAAKEGALTPGPWPGIEWWRDFNDPVLAKLVEESFSNSPEMKLAQAKARFADAQARLAGAVDTPDVSMNAESFRQRISDNGLIPTRFFQNPNTLTQASLAFSYELDIWGLHASIIKSALGEAAAVKAETYMARLLLSFAVAQAYFDLSWFRERLELMGILLANSESLERLAAKRVEGGLDSITSLQKARLDLELMRSSVAGAKRDAGMAANKLAALMGRGPDYAMSSETAKSRDFASPAALPDNLMTDILARRPDIIAAKLRVVTAGYRVDAARALFYPNVNIRALVGLQSVDIEKLFNADSHMYNFGPAIHLPLFDGGRLSANLESRGVEWDMAVEKYNLTVINAVKETADSVISVDGAAKRLESGKMALEAAQAGYEAIRKRREAGLDDAMAEINASGMMIVQRLELATARRENLTARVLLIKSLGGGYMSDELLAGNTK
ncbi:MAG: efflux transporter outer membrane subunit [Nitrospinae bacterium]|nr:efflux transporter outer membrane subunit [Nitrospinota bacterium]